MYRLVSQLNFYICICILTLFSSSAMAAFEGMRQDNGIAYFLFSAPNKILRYDLNSETFLAELSLDKVPTSFAIHNDFIYLSYHREVRKLAIDGSSDEFVRNASASVEEILATENAIYLFHNYSVDVVDIEDLSLIETSSPFYSGGGYVALSDASAYFYRTTGVSPSDIRKSTLAADGSITSDDDSPYHGDYPSASVLYLNDTQNKVYDNSGIVYFTSDLTYAGSLAGSFDKLAFVGDNAIVTRGTLLTVYSPGYVPQGELEINEAPDELAALGDTVFAFNASASSISVTSYDISNIELPSPGEAVDPTGLSYQAEIIENDGVDVTYLYDRENLAIFRWSQSDNAYLESYALLNPSEWMTYSSAHDRLYLGYSDGRITYFDTSVDTSTETQLYTLPSATLGLKAAGNFLIAVDPSGAWGSYYSIDSNGTLMDSVEWQNPSRVYSWNPTTNRIYHFRDGTSPNDVEWLDMDPATGVFGDDGDSPYHGGDLAIRAPLVVSHDGQLILNGGGQLLDAYSLDILNSLSTNISAGVWIGEELVTVDDSGGTLQFWSSNYELLSSYTLVGAQEINLFNQNAKLMLVIQTSGEPQFLEFDLSNIPDQDEDGLHDLEDNCINISNADQNDFDGDLIGDACDSDDDNDSISDELELAHGLNPLDASDASGDLDNDGFDNRTEALLGSNLDDDTSIPEALSSYVEDFENGWPAGIYSNAPDLPWTLVNEGDASATAFSSSYFDDESKQSSFSFTAFFKAGTMSFTAKELGGYAYRYDLNVYVDDEHVRWASTYSDWQTNSFDIDEGLHTIKFVVSADYLYGNESDSSILIDNLTFGADADHDGVADPIDNCPENSNRWQDDSDNDGIGDACDIDPYDQDSDGDGYGDVVDNCPDVANPDQANLDDDYLGDACDDSDDRPSDVDGDGVWDYYDNCIDVANPDQLDADWDWVGDACDDDSDNDGISDQQEALYDFLDPLDASDALLDQDGDGVPNAFEINSGYSPAVPDEHRSHSLMKYFPLGDFSRSYRDDNSYLEEVMESLGAGRYSLSNQHGEEYIYQRTEEGIFLVEYRNSEYVYHMNNNLVVPAQLKLGEVINIDITQDMYDRDGQFIDSYDYSYSLMLTEVSDVSWQGQSYSSITLSDVPGYYQVIYAEGLGTLVKGEMNLHSFSGDSGEASDSKSGGGSSDKFLLLILLFGLLPKFAKYKK